MRKSIVSFAGILSLVPALALADPSTTTTGQQQPYAAVSALQQTSSIGSDPDRVVCKPSAPPIGSRIPAGRECHTQREWDVARQDAQKALSGSQLRDLDSCMPGCSGGR
jgi:hypothetical protein